MPDRALATTTANVLLGEETHGRRGGGSLSHRSGSGTRCVNTDTPRHTHSPSQEGICRDSGRSQGQECLLNQCPLRVELHKLLNQGDRGMSAQGLAPARATSHTHRAEPSWPRSAALSHPECRLPSSVCIFVTSPSSGPDPGRKLCLRWMKGVCSSLLPSSPDSEEDELLPRTLGADPSLARLQQRWPRSVPWGSQGDPGGSGTTEHPKGACAKDLSQISRGEGCFLAAQCSPKLAANSVMPVSSFPPSQTPRRPLAGRAEPGLPNLPFTSGAGRKAGVGRGILFPPFCRRLPQANPCDLQNK